jgi:hypothetical protein
MRGPATGNKKSMACEEGSVYGDTLEANPGHEENSTRGKKEREHL